MTSAPARATRGTSPYTRPTQPAQSSYRGVSSPVKRYVGSPTVSEASRGGTIAYRDGRGVGSRDHRYDGDRRDHAGNRGSLWVSTPKFGLGVSRQGDRYSAAVRIGDRDRDRHHSYRSGCSHGCIGHCSHRSSYYPSYWFSYRSAYPHTRRHYGITTGIGYSYCRPAHVYYTDYYRDYYTGYYPSTVTIYQEAPPTYVVVPPVETVVTEPAESVYLVPDEGEAVAPTTQQTLPPSNSASPYTPLHGDAGLNTPYTPAPAVTPVAPAPQAAAPATSESAPTPAATRWEQYMDAGFKAFTEGKYEAAQRSFMRAMIADDRVALSTLMYGYANFALGDFELATEGVLRAISADERLLREPLAVRSLYADQAVFESHLNAMTQHVAKNADRGGMQLTLAYILFAAEEPDRAWFIVNDLAGQNPEDELLKSFHAAIVSVLEQLSGKPEAAATEPAPSAEAEAPETQPE